MRKLYPLMAIYVGLTLVGCAQTHVTDTATTTTTHQTVTKLPHVDKDPMTVSFYSHATPLKKQYTVIGKETVSKYNVAGLKRQQAVIHDAMRKVAAAMGGDAVINIEHNNKVVTATVITYENNKLA